MSSQNPGEYPETPETGESYEGLSSDYVAYPSEPPSYDPGAALVDENATYGSPEVASYDPNQAYGDPASVYGDLDQAHPEFQQGYVDPAASGAGYQSGHAEYDPYAAPSHGGVYDESPDPIPLAPSRSVAPKKKVGAHAPRRKPVSGKKAPSPRRPGPKPVVYGEGVSMMTVFLTVIALAMLAAVAMVVLPRDMSKVGGYPLNLLSDGKPRNLLAEAQKIMIDRNAELSLSEEEVNRYLNARLQGEQKGPMAALVKFRAVYLDFAPGTAEVIIERELFGMPITMTAKLIVEQARGRAFYKPGGWTLGRVELGERNVKPVIDLFTRLRGACLDEYHAIQQMSDVRFEEDRVVLDARI